MPDFLTLKLAIYFILPAIVLYFVAYVCAGVLTRTAQMVVEHDVSHDMAVRMMAVVIAATTGIVALVQWTTQTLWATLVAGPATFFFVGAFVYSRVFDDFNPRNRGGHFAPIGLPRGSLISAILTFGGLALTMLILWAGARMP